MIAYAVIRDYCWKINNGAMPGAIARAMVDDKTKSLNPRSGVRARSLGRGKTNIGIDFNKFGLGR